jgi:hypothetical protein
MEDKLERLLHDEEYQKQELIRRRELIKEYDRRMFVSNMSKPIYRPGQRFTEPEYIDNKFIEIVAVSPQLGTDTGNDAEYYYFIEEHTKDNEIQYCALKESYLRDYCSLI